MTLFNLGAKNVKHNFKNYISYFISSFISVFILTIFFSIYFNPHIHSFSSSRVKVVAVFKAAAIVVIVFSAIFIWYANSYFIKNKKKQVALYSLLGMKKKEIGILMFCENIFLGILSIVIAVPLGEFSSNFFLKLYAMCIKSNTSIKYSFDIKSILMTIMVFVIIFALNSMKAYYVIYDYELIELMHADKEGESSPKFSKALALLSLIMVLGGYIVTLNVDLSSGGKQMMYKILALSVIIVAGTYILFNNLLIYVFKLSQKNKKTYYKWQNLLSISQLTYRIKGNSNLLATISIISAVAMTALCFTFSFNKMLDESVPNSAPFTISYDGGDKTLNKEVSAVIRKDKGNSITYKKDFKIIKGSGRTPKYKGSLEKLSSFPFDIYIISLSEYNDIMENSNLSKCTGSSARVTDIKINNNNQCFFIEASDLASKRGRLTGSKLHTTIGDNSYKFNISDSDIKGVLGYKLQKATIVVKDTVFKQLAASTKNNIVTWRTYNLKKQYDIKSIAEKLNTIIPSDKVFVCYYNNYIMMHSLYGTFTFIGMFLGILFIASTGSIMYYKQLMEAHEDKHRYTVLSKIGLSKKKTLKLVVKQVGFIFIVPLLFGTLHSAVALKVYVHYLDQGGWGNSIHAIQLIGIMMGIYAAAYLFYYLLSVIAYMKIISRKA
ncbi:ABC transporter permease [Clostridium oryzae]|uniref:ABC transporter permease protein YxdM n=1 Tax=Clostridium oryzae TaxID=1450648 RepID=A0A1V4IW33_9CLOT|nr:FtsX-like permease family protein [Clostridium oryzae]OPJ64005.1 ABC transporter permease protein YxdM [Clostridium oryzae]